MGEQFFGSTYSAKHVSKKKLQKMRDAYAQADKIAQEAHKVEDQERINEQKRLDTILNELL